MNEEEFIRLVRRAEKEVESNPGLYQMKLALFAVLGYIVIFTILMVMVVLLGGMAAAVLFSSSLALVLLKKKVFLPVVVMIWIMAKSLWVKFERPEGYELDREHFPELFSEIDSLRQELKSLPIHKVILTPELNAAVSQTPRLGVFGWQFNTLFLGLELLLLLSPEEARSVLGHEFGHLSKNHSRFSTWIYRIRSTWYQMMEGFHQNESIGAKVMRRFFDWYAPKFSAYSFALARSNEYEADAVAAELTSNETIATALINVNVTGPYVDENYWQWFFKKADEMSEPDHMPYAGLAGYLSGNSQSQEVITDYLDRHMKVETSYDDTHPSLKDRIDELGIAPVLPQPTGRHNAAATWLGKQYQRVVNDFDNDWYEGTKEKWIERYQYVQESAAGLAELEMRPLDSLDWQEHWNLAAWTEEFKTGEDALPIYRQYQVRFPEDLDAAYVVGRLLYEQDSDECLQHFEAAAEKHDLTIRACEYAYTHLMKKGAEEVAEVWRQRALERMDLDRKAEEERSYVSVNAELLEADMPDEQEKLLVEQLTASKYVKSAWVARKQVQYYPEDPVYVVAFKSRGFYWSWDNVVQRVLAEVDVTGHVFFVVMGGDYRKMAKRVVKAGKRIV